MAARHLVGVYGSSKDVTSSITLPVVLTAPIRPDLVHDVHSRMALNRRQPYAVSRRAGHQTSAESWGTGRAVARIPRVPGGGTHRAGQAAFGNMCRGGRMFAPTKTWRRWHRRINVTQKRHAYAAALSASAIPALVMARGHKIDQVSEIPLVIDNKTCDTLDKTSAAVALLKSFAAFEDVQKVEDSIKMRCGKGKMRNRRWTQRRGPLVIYNKPGPMVKAFRNIPGVELSSVHKLNLLQLAPGGHIGRFIIWTKDAFEHLDTLFGTYRKSSQSMEGYTLPRGLINNTDLQRLMSSQEIQSVLRDRKSRKTPRQFQRPNPLKNAQLRVKLNPHAQTVTRHNIMKRLAASKKSAELAQKKQKGVKIERTKEDIADRKAIASFKKSTRQFRKFMA